jgi:hypothetical protein
VYLYNNTLYGNGWSGAAYPGETGSLLFHAEALSRATIHLGNNIVYSTGEPYLAGDSAALPAADYRNSWYGDGTGPAWDTGTVNDNPDFVNAGGFDFRLLEGSPAIDTGRNLAAVVPRDLLGVPRPQGTALDLGAYESAGPAPVPDHFQYLPLVPR